MEQGPQQDFQEGAASSVAERSNSAFASGGSANVANSLRLMPLAKNGGKAQKVTPAEYGADCNLVIAVFLLDSQGSRRGVRAVEGARLESVCWGNPTVGSNPTLSAISLFSTG
jgi:hypothetical protein